MEKIIILLIGLVSLAIAVKYTQLDGYTFEHFKREHGRNYESSEEESYRRELFELELARVKRHNLDGTKTWKEGINHFSDRTYEEFSRVLGLKKNLLYSQKAARNIDVVKRSKVSVENLPLPSHVDWRTQGIISAVKDQGDCGSCWSFATAETLEAYFALSSGFLTDLSEQQVLDCTPNPDQCGGTGGCAGGTVELAYARINEIGGLSTEWTYSYRSYSGNNFECQNESITPVVNAVNFTVLPSNELAPLLEHVAIYGPLAISVDASSWPSYESGVYNGCNQTNPDLDHAVQLVGYGTDENLGLPYWLIRNSWNPSWGEDGYIRILRETSNPVCGIDVQPSDGDGCKNGPPEVKVCGTCGILYDSVYVNAESIWTK